MLECSSAYLVISKNISALPVTRTFRKNYTLKIAIFLLHLTEFLVWLLLFSAVFLKNDPFPDSFYLFSSFQCSWHRVHDRIRTADLWYWKWPLSQLSHDDCCCTQTKAFVWQEKCNKKSNPTNVTNWLDYFRFQLIDRMMVASATRNPLREASNEHNQSHKIHSVVIVKVIKSTFVNPLNML